MQILKGQKEEKNEEMFDRFVNVGASPSFQHDGFCPGC
jgi:hypothetical protein